MSEMSNEAIQAQIEVNRVAATRLKTGEGVLTSGFAAETVDQILYIDSNSNFTANTVTASKPMYMDSNKVPQAANIPFATSMAGLVVEGMVNTTLSVLNLTGTSNPVTDDLLMQGQLVKGSQVSTFTTTAFIQVNITDDSPAGNVTDGVHYIQIGTLT